MKRTVDGRFGSGTCDSKIHDQSQPHIYLTNLSSNKRLSKKNYNVLVSSNMLNGNAKNVCKCCMEKILISNSLEKPLEQDTMNAENNINDENNNDDIDEEYSNYLSEKAIQLGNELNPILKIDVKQLKDAKIKSVEEVLIHNPLNWCSERPNPLIQLLCSLCGTDINSASENQILLISKIIENIYSCINSKIILPNHFVGNLLCYSLTN